MAAPQVRSSNQPVRCPNCGTERVQARSERDPIDPVYRTPSSMVQRLLGAPLQLYHCYVCRVQFYEAGETAPAPPVNNGAPAPREAAVAAAPVALGDTFIGAGVTIQGRVCASEAVVLDGEIEGPVDIPAHRFMIGPTGRIRGDVRADEVVVLGAASGAIEGTSRVAIGSAAMVAGDIRTRSLRIEEGAHVRGKVEVIQ
jgi:cytoskeletal protein CcmA (bactofilin family)